eukprot:scaffold342_cov128-Amphora_coffeaeformis.AAC.1
MWLTLTTNARTKTAQHHHGGTRQKQRNADQSFESNNKAVLFLLPPLFFANELEQTNQWVAKANKPAGISP